MKIGLKLLSVACAALLVQGCSLPRQPKTWNVSGAFDEAAASELLEPGTNSISGNAFMRQQGGGVVTCAGELVRLIPATPYAKDRTRKEYANLQWYDRPLSYTPNPPKYHTLQKTARCDAQGRFTFDGVKDGEFIVVTSVNWSVPYHGPQGGFLAETVRTGGGKPVSVVMSR